MTENTLRWLSKSKIRREIVRLFLRHPGKRFFLREIERETRIPIGNVRRTLLQLEGASVVGSQREGQHIFYKLLSGTEIAARLVRDWKKKPKHSFLDRPERIKSPDLYLEINQLPFLDEDSKRAVIALAYQLRFPQFWTLFVGSGVSSGSGVPTGQQLVERFNRILDKNYSERELPEAASDYQIKYGREGLIDFLIQEFKALGLKPNQTHDLLLSLNPETIITTNVEDILESKLRDLGRSFLVRRTNREIRNSEDILLVKPHGDLAHPDTLVLTSEDYDKVYYDSNKETILTDIKSYFANRPFLFVGYSLSDAHFRSFFYRITGLQATPAPRHFMIVNQVDASYSQRFLTYGIRLISIQDYKNMVPLLQAISKTVSGQHKLLGAVSVYPSSHLASDDTDRVAQELMNEGFRPVAEAMKTFKYRTAEQRLNTFLEKLQAINNGGRHTDFHQRVLLNLATLNIRKGNASQARQLFLQSETLGRFLGKRLIHASEVLLNLGYFDQSLELLKESSLPEHAREVDRLKNLATMLSGRKNHGPDDPSLLRSDDADFIIQGVRIRMDLMKAEEVPILDTLLDKAWDLGNGIPPVHKVISQLSFELLRKILQRKWKLNKFNRKIFIEKLQSRFDLLPAIYDGLKDEFPEDYVAALGLCVNFSSFIGDQDAVNSLGRRIDESQLQSQAKLSYQVMSGKKINVSEVEKLKFSEFDRRILFGQIWMGQKDKLEEAEKEYKLALECADTKDKRDYCIELLLNTYIKADKISAALSFIEEKVSTDDQSTKQQLNGLIFAHQGKLDEAIRVYERLLANDRRNYVLLHNLSTFYQKTCLKNSQSNDLEGAALNAKKGIQTARRLFALFPVSQFVIMRASFALSTQETKRSDLESLREKLESLVREDFSKRIKIHLIRVLEALGRYEEAAVIIQNHPQQFMDYVDKRWEGELWARADKLDNAIGCWEPLLKNEATDETLYQILCMAFMQKGNDVPEYMDKAFDLAKIGLKRYPNNHIFPAMIFWFGQSRGDSKEAWEALKSVDLKDNKFLRAIPASEGLDLLRKDIERARLRQRLYHAGIMPFEVMAKNTARPAVFLWMSRVMAWKERRTTFPILTGFPRTSIYIYPPPEIPGKIFMDKTALLTLASLGIEREFFEICHKSNSRIEVEGDILEWCNNEINSLQMDQLPGYRNKYKRLKYDLESARQKVDILPVFEGDFQFVGENVQKALGDFSLDLEISRRRNAFYLDDYIPENPTLVIENRLSSADLLSFLTSREITKKTAENLKTRFPDPLGRNGTSKHLPKRFTLVMALESLRLWHETGLLREWLTGKVDWLEQLIVGPMCWQQLSGEVLEGEIYAESLQVAKSLRKNLDDALKNGWLEERQRTLNHDILSRFDETAQKIYGDSILQLTECKNKNSSFCTEDFCLRLLLDRKGQISADPRIQDLNRQFQHRFPEVEVMDLSEILWALNAAGKLSEDRYLEIILDFHEAGYRGQSLAPALLILLQQNDLSMENSVIGRILGGFEKLKEIPIDGVDRRRLSLYIKHYAGEEIGFIMTSLWRSEKGKYDFQKIKEVSIGLLQQVEALFDRDDRLVRQLFWEGFFLNFCTLDMTNPSYSLRDFLSFITHDAKLTDNEVRFIVQKAEDSMIKTWQTWADLEHEDAWGIVMQRFILPLLAPGIIHLLREPVSTLIPLTEPSIRMEMNVTVEKDAFSIPMDDLYEKAAELFKRFVENEDTPGIIAVTPFSMQILINVERNLKHVDVPVRILTIALLSRLDGRYRDLLENHFKYEFNIVDPFLRNHLDKVSLSPESSKKYLPFFRAYLGSVSLQFDLGLKIGIEWIKNCQWKVFSRLIGGLPIFTQEGLIEYCKGLLKNKENEEGVSVLFSVLGGILEDRTFVNGHRERLRALEEQARKRVLDRLMQEAINDADTFASLKALRVLADNCESYRDDLVMIEGQHRALTERLQEKFTSILRQHWAVQEPIKDKSVMAPIRSIAYRPVDLHALILRIARSVTATPTRANQLLSKTDAGHDLTATWLLYGTVIAFRIAGQIACRNWVSPITYAELKTLESEFSKGQEEIKDQFMPSLYGTGPEAYNPYVVGALKILTETPRCIHYSKEILSLINRIADSQENSAEKTVLIARTQNWPNRLAMFLNHTPQEYAKSLLKLISGS